MLYEKPQSLIEFKRESIFLSQLQIIIPFPQLPFFFQPSPIYLPIKYQKLLFSNKDDNLFLHVQNIETGLSGVASFYNDGKTIKVFAGNSDGSDDIELNYLDFINHYNYIVGKDFENPFMDIKI